MADGVLAPEHDAAHVHWGGGWRMPTKQELDDLISKCNWAWTTVNGVQGWIITGKDSASIFLPCAGLGKGTSLDYAGSEGLYWSSELNSSYSYYGGNGTSCDLYFYLGRYNANDQSLCIYGFSVRPVQDFTE